MSLYAATVGDIGYSMGTVLAISLSNLTPKQAIGATMTWGVIAAVASVAMKAFATFSTPVILGVAASIGITIGLINQDPQTEKVEGIAKAVINGLFAIMATGCIFAAAYGVNLTAFSAAWLSRPLAHFIVHHSKMPS